MARINKNYMFAWIEEQQSWGRYVFSLERVKKEFPELSEAAILLSLNRLSGKNRIVSIYKGFYLIVPPEYSSKGILPPLNFIDDLMTFIGKPYYVGLLSAAALHGAAHQQPQEFFIITSSKQLATRKKGIIINYFTKKNISRISVEKRKTEMGYVYVSSPELTAADLVYYQNRIGGLNRICLVINELAEVMKVKNITPELVSILTIPTIQRLGFILERIVYQEVLAERLYSVSQQKNRKFFWQPLKTGGERKGSDTDGKWKIIINTTVTIEE